MLYRTLCAFAREIKFWRIGSSGAPENVRCRLAGIFSRLKLMRQWAGIVDVTPDTLPIIGHTPVKGLYLNGGWGTGGFRSSIL